MDPSNYVTIKIYRQDELTFVVDVGGILTKAFNKKDFKDMLLFINNNVKQLPIPKSFIGVQESEDVDIPVNSTKKHKVLKATKEELQQSMFGDLSNL